MRRHRPHWAFAVPALALLLLPLAAPKPSSAQETEAASVAPGAILRGLDKVAGTITDIELSSGDSATFARLTITLTECRYPQGNPASDAFAHVTIHDSLQPDGAIFQGWMIASSPALNALDHARFDVWLLRCTTS